MNILQAYGVLASPLQLSAAFSSLGVSHILIDSSLHASPHIKEVAKAQPAWPIIVPSLKALNRHWAPYERQILYVCGSLDELKATNIRVIKEWRTNLQRSLRYALTQPVQDDWQLQINEPTMEDYVHKATKPSFLNHVQAEIYKLTPYDLRKSVQALTIAYLSGNSGFAQLKLKLASSYKLDRLRELMDDPKCRTLRQAVADYRKTKDEQLTAKAYGVETFEIMYLFKQPAKSI